MVIVFMACFLCQSVSRGWAAGEGSKLADLGLNAATAMASKKDVVKGLKDTAKDEYTDWLWEAVGGTEQFMTGNAEAQIPAAKDKILKIVDTVKKIEAFTLAMAEGKYEEATFMALDEAVGSIDHPLVAVTWEMAKLTYESHKLVQSSKAALQVEHIYGVVSSDRRMMGVVDPNADSPALIPLDKASVDYFFNRYVITGKSARSSLRAYVETVLGEDWPEESWSDYVKSWRMIGSGLDTARDSETEMLATEWRNKARGWTLQLLKEANKKAKQAWAEARLRRQMTEFQKFADRVGHFYEDDMERMLEEFLAIKAARAAEKELQKLPQKSQKAYAEMRPKISKMDAKDLKHASSWQEKINQWQLTCLSAGSKMQAVNEGLSQSIYAEREKWLSLAEQLESVVQQKKGDVYQGVEEEAFPDREYGSGLSRQTRKQRHAEIEARAKKFYAEFFEPLFTEFDWVAVQKEIEVTDLGGEAKKEPITAEPEELPEKVLERLNQGDFKGAQAMTDFWSKDVRRAIYKHFSEIEQAIKNVLRETPRSVLAAEKKVIQVQERYAELKNKLNPKIAANRKRIDEVIHEYNTFYGVNWKKVEADGQYQSLVASNRAMEEQKRSFSRSNVQPARYAHRVLKSGWARASGLPMPVLERMKSLEMVTYKDVHRQITEARSAFVELAQARRQQYDSYQSQCGVILKMLPRPGAEKYWLSEDELKRAREGTYTYMAKAKTDGPVRAADMTSALAAMAPDTDNRGLADRLLGRAVDIEAREPNWQQARQKFAQLPILDAQDVEQIRVFVDPEFDPNKCRESIKEAMAIAQNISSMKSKLKSAAQKAATDERNRQADRDLVNEKIDMINMYFSVMQNQGLIRWSVDDYQIVLPEKGYNGMVRIKEPYPHYATREELQPFVQPVRQAWSQLKARSFAQKYTPKHVAKWEQIMSLDNIPMAKEPNFIAPNYNLPIYESDLEKAKKLLENTSGDSPDYKQTMEQVAELVPGLMQVPTVIDKQRDEQQAKLYKMDLQEYYKKVKKPQKIYYYRIHEKAQEAIDSGELDHDLGKIYAALGQRVEELHFEYKDYQAKQKELEAQEMARQIEEEQRRKMKAEGEKTVNAMDSNQLAAFYGYTFEDARLNSRSVSNMRGDVILTPKDLIAGDIVVEGRLFTLDKAETLLLSKDGGRTWEQIGLARQIRYRFRPVPGMPYDFILRIKTTDGREARLKLFNTVESFVYHDVNMDQLVAQTIKLIAEAYENMNLVAFMQHVARDYLGNKAILEEGVRFDFDMFTNIRLTIYINRITQRGNLFVAETKWDKKQTPRTTGQEQRTTGKTTFIFGLQDGKMKIKNLRGDLIYATLSPQIAQASGKSSSVVDQIRTARDDRNPTQPGAGETEDEGGVSSGNGGEDVASSLTVTSPNGGENWGRGTTHNITWTSSGIVAVKIEYWEGWWVPIVDSTPANTGTYSWTIDPFIGAVAASEVRITAVEDPSVSDTSDNTFSIF